MDKAKTYITDEEIINCQKVADTFSELFDNEGLIILNAGKYGFVKCNILSSLLALILWTAIITAKVCLMTFGTNGYIHSLSICHQTHLWRIWIMTTY